MMSSTRAILFGLLCASAAAASCQPETQDAPGARSSEPSPNASILPAPLASDLAPDKADGGEGADADAGVDAGAIVAQSLGLDGNLGDDVVSGRDSLGTTLQARWRWLDVALPSRLPEANAEALERIRDGLSFDFDIELTTTGRMRIVLAADTFVLPRGSELRARLDLFGHAMVWPDRSKYSILAPGSLRALFNERRSDVVPLTRPKPTPLGSGEAQGLPTERQSLVTPHGRLEIDQTHLVGSGFGGILLCRALVELLATHPDSTICAPEMIPLRAEYSWADGGRAAFEVFKHARSAELAPEVFALPPARAVFGRAELPAEVPPPLVTDEELGRFRLRPVARTETKDKKDKADKRVGPAVKEGLLVVNRGELSAYLLIDGIPVLRAAPRSDDYSLPLMAGTYYAAARDFLGTVTLSQSVVSVPARLVLSPVADAER
jgi:hypothetical protein